MMMKVAIPYWQNRVSPVFDVAERLLLVEIDGNREVHRQEIYLPMTNVHMRVAALKDLNVDQVIYGAISRLVELGLIAAKIEVISQVCGDVEAVLSAFMSGRLDQELFLMPGCYGRHRRRFRGGRW